MATETTQMYNTGYDNLFTDGVVGADEFMWVLVDSNYIADPIDTDASDFGGNESASAISATSVDITNTPGTAAESFFQTANVQFGPAAMTYKYLVLVRPAVAGNYVADTTTKLIFYVDLTGGDSNDETAAGDYVTVNITGNGWFKMVQA